VIKVAAYSTDHHRNQNTDKLISVDFVLGGQQIGNRIRVLEKCKFRLQYLFSNDYICSSLPIFTKFCTWLDTVVGSMSIAFETNQK